MVHTVQVDFVVVLVELHLQINQEDRWNNQQKIKLQIHWKIKNINYIHVKFVINSFYRNEGYNTSRVFCSKECHNIWADNRNEYINYDLITLNANKTKRKNKTFKSSKKELEIYKLLKEKYHDIIYQYTSIEYPFNCDFYIPSLKLYIEYNGIWTHGKHIFDCNSKEDIEKLNLWKEKSKTSKYYKIAIHTWTDLDIRKQEYVKQNNLNHIIFWNDNDVNNFLNNKNWIIFITKNNARVAQGQSNGLLNRRSRYHNSPRA